MLWNGAMWCEQMLPSVMVIPVNATFKLTGLLGDVWSTMFVAVRLHIFHDGAASTDSNGMCAVKGACRCRNGVVVAVVYLGRFAWLVVVVVAVVVVFIALSVLSRKKGSLNWKCR